MIIVTCDYVIMYQGGIYLGNFGQIFLMLVGIVKTNHNIIGGGKGGGRYRSWCLIYLVAGMEWASNTVPIKKFIL